MKKKKPVLLGVCPIGKFVFSHEDALRQKQTILEKLDEWHVNYCTINGVITESNASKIRYVRDEFLRMHKGVMPGELNGKYTG